MLKLCSFLVTLEMGLWAELIEGDTGTLKKKKNHERNKKREQSLWENSEKERRRG